MKNRSPVALPRSAADKKIIYVHNVRKRKQAKRRKRNEIYVGLILSETVTIIDLFQGRISASQGEKRKRDKSGKKEISNRISNEGKKEKKE